LSFATVPASLERKDARRRRETIAKSFPHAQVVLLGIGVLTLAALGVVAAVEVRGEVAIGLTLPPLLLLPAVYITSSLLTRRSGSGALAEALDYLGPG
jgi:hypothetical protein